MSLVSSNPLALQAVKVIRESLDLNLIPEIIKMIVEYAKAPPHIGCNKIKEGSARYFSTQDGSIYNPLYFKCDEMLALPGITKIRHTGVLDVVDYDHNNLSVVVRVGHSRHTVHLEWDEKKECWDVKSEFKDFDISTILRHFLKRTEVRCGRIGLMELCFDNYHELAAI